MKRGIKRSFGIVVFSMLLIISQFKSRSPEVFPGSITGRPVCESEMVEEYKRIWI